MSGIHSAQTDITPLVGNAGIDSSVGSTGRRIASVRSRAGSEGVEDALFREEEKEAGISPMSSSTSASRQPRFKGMVQVRA